MCMVTYNKIGHYQNEREAGPNNYHSGAWDCLEGQDSINLSSKQKCRRSTIAVFLAAQTATIVVVRHFLLGISASPFPPNDPSAFALLILTQIPTRFGNRQFSGKAERQALVALPPSPTISKPPRHRHTPKFTQYVVGAMCFLTQPEAKIAHIFRIM